MNIKLNEWNTVESRIFPSTYGNPIYGNGGKSIQWGKDCYMHKWSWHSSYLSGRKQNSVS